LQASLSRLRENCSLPHVHAVAHRGLLRHTNQMSARVDQDAPIKVAIVEDDEGVRSSIAALIRRASALQLAGEYPDAEAALREIPRQPPHVVVMDINLPGLNGIECVRQLKSSQRAA